MTLENTDNNADLELATLIARRICHDLVSPIGAIGNGIDLLQLEDSDNEIYQLIDDGYDAARAKLEFFRIAYGAPSEASIAPSAAQKLMIGGLHNPRIEIDFEPQGDLKRNTVQLVALCLQCLEAALPTGGRIAIQEQSEGHWTLTARSLKINHDNALWRGLETGHFQALEPRDAQFGLLSQIVEKNKLSLTIDSSQPEQLLISF